MTTKILALTDALCNLVRFRLMPGQRYDSVEVPPLIDGIAFDGLTIENFCRLKEFKRIAMRACKPIAASKP